MATMVTPKRNKNIHLSDLRTNKANNNAKFVLHFQNQDDQLYQSIKSKCFNIKMHTVKKFF